MTDVKHEIPRLTWGMLQAEYSRFEIEQRAQGKLWRDIPSITDWTVERIAQLTAENESLRREVVVAENRRNATIALQIKAELDAALREVDWLKAQVDWEEDTARAAAVNSLEAEISRLKAPVSDEEWGKGRHLANRSHVNNIIANRQRTSHDRH